MKPEKPTEKSTDAADLRRRAQARLQSQPPPPKVPGSTDEMQRHLQELQTHQIELEMQNEELREARVWLEASAARYTNLYNLAPVGYFTTGLKGEIIQANLAGARLLGLERSRLLDYRFDAFVVSADLPAFRTLLTRAFASQPPETIEVRLAIKDKPPLTVLLQAYVSEDGLESHLVLTDITERRQAEVALRASEEKHRLLFENAGDVIFIISEEGQILDANPMAVKLLGYTRPELMSMTLHQIDSLEDRLDTADRIARLIQEGHLTFETVFQHKDGSLIPIDVNARRIVWDGKPLLLGIGRDITERKQAERESQRLFAAMADTAPVLIWASGRDKWCNYFNKTWLDFTGRTMDQEMGNGWTEGVHPDDLVRYLEIYVGSFDEQKPFQMEYRLRRHDGEYRWILDSGTPRYDVGGDFAGYIGSCTDITENKRAQEALRAETIRRHTLFEQSPDGILIIDPETTQFLEFNTAAHRQLGYSREEFAGLSISDVEARETREETKAHIAECIQKGHSDFETLQRTRDGEVRDVHVTIHIVDVAGQQLYQCIWRDITDRKRAGAEKERLEAQNRQLQKAESLGRMAGAIAHNFNNQLAAVIMNLELLQQELPPNAGPGLDLSTALQSARKAATIGTQMLTYLGQTHARLEPLDFSEACRRSLPLLEAGIPHTVVLKTDLPAPGPVIQANANQIQQVLTSLLTNAWEASSRPGDGILVTVKLAPAAGIPAAHRFPVGWQPQDSAYACLEVADSGCGIAAEDIERIFDPFFTNKFTGRGMELAVVLGIVRGYGGGITVESKPGQGSVFRVFLPVSAAAILQEPIPVAPAPKTAGRGAVLVVEDEPPLRATVTRALQRYGYTVFAAADGVEAVELFEQHREEIHCVLCDLTMPRMDGWETLTALRKLTPGLPVILSSGYDAATVMEGNHTELPQAFLHKPYDLKALIDLVKRFQPEVSGKKRE